MSVFLFFVQLNFAKVRRHLKGYKKTTTNTQVVGFSESDSYADVLMKASGGLSIKCDLKELRLICSGGLVKDSEINGQPWSLGQYIIQIGGNQNRSKRVWGVYIPTGFDEAEPSCSSTQDSV